MSIFFFPLFSQETAEKYFSCYLHCFVKRKFIVKNEIRICNRFNCSKECSNNYFGGNVFNHLFLFTLLKKACKNMNDFFIAHLIKFLFAVGSVNLYIL